MATAEDPNTEIVGKYKVTQTLKNQLGHGSTGIVYLAICVDGGKEVAAKKVTLEQEFLNDADFEWEAHMLLHQIPPHRNIIQVHDFIKKDFIEKSRPMVNLWLVTEYCPLGSLMDYAYVTKMESKKKLKIIYQLFLAVSHLHDHRVVHRDIKPENILLTGKSTCPIVKLTDFDTARTVIRDDGRSVFMGSLAGTNCWMAPEQVPMEGVQLRYNKSVDVYSTALSSLALLDSCKGSIMRPRRMNNKSLADAMREMNVSCDLAASWYSPPIYNAEDNDLDMAIKDILKPMLSFCPAHRPSMADVVQTLAELHSQALTEALLAVRGRSVWEREGDAWAQRPDVTEDKIWYISFCAVSGGIMAVGGRDYNDNLTVISRCYHFSLSTCTWERVADMITARYGASAAVLGDAMMVVGGGDSSGNDLAICESFHIGEGVWSSVACLLEPLWKPLVASAAEKLFVMPRSDKVSGRKMQQYDAGQDRFSWAAPIPDYVQKTHEASLVSSEDLLYLLGGTERLAVQYNPSTAAWTQLISRPLLTGYYMGCSAVVHNAMILLCGGHKEDEAWCGVEKYDPQTQQWEQSDIRLPFSYDLCDSFVCSIDV